MLQARTPKFTRRMCNSGFHFAFFFWFLQLVHMRCTSFKVFTCISIIKNLFSRKIQIHKLLEENVSVQLSIMKCLFSLKLNIIRNTNFTSLFFSLQKYTRHTSSLQKRKNFLFRLQCSISLWSCTQH